MLHFFQTYPYLLHYLNSFDKVSFLLYNKAKFFVI